MISEAELLAGDINSVTQAFSKCSSLSLHFKSHFPGEPELAGFY